MKGDIDTESPEDESLDSLCSFYLNKRDIDDDIPQALNYFEEFISENNYNIEDIGIQEAGEFAEYLKSSKLKTSTARAYYSSLCSFTSWYHSRGVFEYDPFSLAREDIVSFDVADTVKRKVPIEDLRLYIRKIGRPLLLALIVTFLKTGMRRSEVYNLDLRDIHLDHPISEDLPEPRAKIYQKPDSLYVDSSINEGDIYNGEKRERGNKHKSSRAIPIDKELKRTLVWYIATQLPTDSEAKPLFRTNNQNMGSRLGYQKMRQEIHGWARDNGLRDGENELNVSSHWFRHWFTTKLRNNIDPHEIGFGTVDGYVKGLRGDSDEDTIDIYTHNWSQEEWMRKAYLDNIPSLFTGLDEDHYANVESNGELIQE